MTDIEVYFLSIFSITGWCVGFRTFTEEGQIGFPIRKLLLKMGEAGKPLGSCVRCMPSVHGSIIYWILVWRFLYIPTEPLPLNTLFLFPLAIVPCVYLSQFLWNRLPRY